jgi:hypothetical protein
MKPKRWIVADAKHPLLATDCATREEAEYWREIMIEWALNETGRDMSNEFLVRESTGKDRKYFGAKHTAGVIVGPPDTHLSILFSISITVEFSVCISPNGNGMSE